MEVGSVKIVDHFLGKAWIIYHSFCWRNWNQWHPHPPRLKSRLLPWQGPSAKELFVRRLTLIGYHYFICVIRYFRHWITTWKQVSVMSYCWAKKQHRPRLLYNSALPKMLNLSTWLEVFSEETWERRSMISTIDMEFTCAMRHENDYNLCPSAEASDKTSGSVLVGPSRNGSCLEKEYGLSSTCLKQLYLPMQAIASTWVLSSPSTVL